MKIIKIVAKNSTEYKLIFYTREVSSSMNVNISISNQVVGTVSVSRNQKYEINITTPANMTDDILKFEGTSYNKQIYDVMLLEVGVAVPSYFNGMKSVGELEGNKIEIKSAKDSLNNKKIIELGEPLRGLPNGVKDRFVKMSGKWYIERNCSEVVLNGSEGWSAYNQNDATYCCKVVVSDVFNNAKLATPLLSANIPYIQSIWNNDCLTEGIQLDSNGWSHCRLNKSKLETPDVAGFKKWLQANNVTVTYQLATPTYELITNPTLTTYLNSTQVTNNSFVPCNMKVKNSGYNTIIKPNTLYTVALDTNKNGTIGLNLGGSKVTTTNNVATVTTPATLSDDSLRVFGKGVKGKDVRLLEGNKTNWIPSMFNGMLSCFEDNENLVDIMCSDGELSNKIQFLLNEPLRKWDKFVLVDGKPMIERGSGEVTFTNNQNDFKYGSVIESGKAFGLVVNKLSILSNATSASFIQKKTTSFSDKFSESYNGIWYNRKGCYYENTSNWVFVFDNSLDIEQAKLKIIGTRLVYQLEIPTYEPLPLELQQIILECYENGTLFIDTIIPPTVTAKYAGEAPATTSLKQTKNTVATNISDINDSIVPYMLDMDYRVATIQQQTGQVVNGYKSLSNINKLLERDILSNRLSKEEYRNRINTYLHSGKITNEEYEVLGGILND